MENKCYGYVRVSSKDQNIDRQLSAMKGLGIKKERIYIDKLSGKDFNRPSYKRMVKKLKAGDILYLKSIDRLGRDYDEIIEQWRILTRVKDIDIVIIDFPLLNTKNQVNGITGKFIADLVLQILSYVAQIERENIKQRQAEGIKEALAKGARFGRPKLDIPKEFYNIYQQWDKKQISMRQAAKSLGTNHTTLRHWINDYEKKESNV